MDRYPAVAVDPWTNRQRDSKPAGRQTALSLKVAGASGGFAWGGAAGEWGSCARHWTLRTSIVWPTPPYAGRDVWPQCRGSDVAIAKHCAIHANLRGKRRTVPCSLGRDRPHKSLIAFAETPHSLSVCCNSLRAAWFRRKQFFIAIENGDWPRPGRQFDGIIITLRNYPIHKQSYLVSRRDFGREANRNSFCVEEFPCMDAFTGGTIR